MRQHPSGDDSGVESVLHEAARRGVGALAGAADDEDLAVTWELVEMRAQLTQRDIIAPGTCSTASSTFSRTSRRKPPFAESHWLSGMSPRSTSAATIPAKLIGSFALPNGGE